jgi:hypothetical protein
MSFSDLLGNAAQKLQGNGFANEIGLPTMLFDLSSVSSNDKSWVGDAFNFAGNAFRTTLQATTYPIRKPIGATFDKVLLPAAMTSYETGGRFLRQPLSAALTTVATLNPKKAWENRDEISPGQALAYLQSIPGLPGSIGEKDFAPDFDIFDPNDRKVFEDDWSLRTLSGTYDTFFTTVTDPLGKLGKAAGLARKAVVTRPLGATDANANTIMRDFFMPRTLRSVKVISPQTLAKTINEGREEGGELYNTLSWFAKSDRVAIRNHPMIQQSNDADTLAYLLGEAKTTDDVADTLIATARLGTNKQIGAASARLIGKRRDLAFVLDKINDTTDLDKKVLNNVPTNGITDDVNKLDSATELVKQVEADPYYRMIRSFNDKAADLSKRTFGKPVFEKLAISRAESKAARIKGIDQPTKFPTVGVIQPTKYHPLIAVVNFGMKKIGDSFQEKPAGYVNFNDSDSFGEMTAFGEQLRRLVGRDIAQPIVDEHTRAYMRAGGLPELRSTVAVSFEDLAVSAVNRSLGLTDEQGAFIWNQYKSRRQTALDTVRDRKFLMTNDDVILKIPYLERQGANALPMVDLENYSRVLKANMGVLKSIGRKGEIIDPDTMRYVSGILNDMWKASVLLRLGYTIRNVSEATLSILGKGYGLLALGDLNRDGFKSWYNNRVQGVERLADRTLVNKGLREDSIQIRRSLAETQSEIFATEKVINEARLYAQAAERLFLQGKLNETQYKELLELSEYLSGQYLYHGSTTPIRALDNNKPLAMSFSEDIAEQYADAGMPRISASEIYKRLSGRAYPLPKNLERSPAAEIGTQPIVERISNEAFTELNSYVNGDFGDVQAGLRDPNFAVSRGKNVPELPKGLQRTIQRSVLTKPLTVYRGTTNRNSPFATAQVGDIIEEPAFVSTTYNDNVARNFATPSPIEKVDVLNLQPGGPLTLPGSISTQIEMKLPKGLNALDIAETYNQMKNLGYANLQRESMLMVNRESEVLLPAGTKFRVLSRGGDAENGYAVTVEAILPP